VNDRKFVVIIGLQTVIIVLLGAMVVLQYLTLQHVPRPVTWTMLQEAKDPAEIERLILALPTVRVYDLHGTVDVEVQNTVDVDVQNTPLAVENY